MFLLLASAAFALNVISPSAHGLAGIREDKQVSMSEAGAALAVDLRSFPAMPSCDANWTDCCGCHSTGAHCGTPSGEQGEVGGHTAVVYCGEANCPQAVVDACPSGGGGSGGGSGGAPACIDETALSAGSCTWLPMDEGAELPLTCSTLKAILDPGGCAAACTGDERATVVGILSPYLADGETTDCLTETGTCTPDGQDRNAAGNLGPCCNAECTEARPTDLPDYCAEGTAGHGSSCWSNIVMCRAACDPGVTGSNHFDITDAARESCVSLRAASRSLLAGGDACHDSATTAAQCAALAEAKWRGDHRVTDEASEVTGNPLATDNGLTLMGEVHLCEWLIDTQSCEAGKVVTVCPEEEVIQVEEQTG